MMSFKLTIVTTIINMPDRTKQSAILCWKGDVFLNTIKKKVEKQSVSPMSTVTEHSAVPQKILTINVATCVVRALIQCIEHSGACLAAILHCTIAIILKKVSTIENSKGDRLRKIIAWRYIAEYVTIRVALMMAVGLLKSEFHKKAKELVRIECSSYVRTLYERQIRMQYEWELESKEEHQDAALRRHFCDIFLRL